MKQFGILTSGGDCPGLNAAIFSAAKTALTAGCKLIGIVDGFQGLLSKTTETVPLTAPLFDALHNASRLSGTFLGARNKGDAFKKAFKDNPHDFVDIFAKKCNALKLSGIIGIGGDGSLAALHQLTKMGEVPFVGLPKTIDNDIPETVAIGFQSAVAAATQAIDAIHMTARSHGRIMIVEVMGREAGHIALEAGIASNADIILIPEIPYKIEALQSKIQHITDQGQSHVVIVTAEAAHENENGAHITRDHQGRSRFSGAGQALQNKLAPLFSQEVRTTSLGHTLRGALPIAQDRLMATTLGALAFDKLHAGESGLLLGWDGQQSIDISLETILNKKAPVNLQGNYVAAAKKMGISLGI